MPRWWLQQIGTCCTFQGMSSKLLSTTDLESDTAIGKVEKPLKQTKKKGKKEKPKASKIEDAVEK